MGNQTSIRIRKSRKEDIPDILRIYASAREYMRLNNNPNQWSGNYPGESDIIKIKMENKFEILSELLKKDRSYRRFDESFKIDAGTLKRLVELTRYCSSGRNLQPLKYFIVNDEEKCEQIFPLLKWAGYLKEWDDPEKGERPSAYLIQCLDTNLTKNYLCDDGLQLQAITLGATALGLGCCIIKSFNIVKLKEILSLEENLSPLYILAIGKPVETVVIEKLKDTGEEGIKYYRTPDKVHHVPKRSLEELLINH